MFGLSSLYTTLIGGAMLAAASFGGGYWTATKFDSIPYNKLVASNASLQVEYSDYKRDVAVKSAKASSDALAEQNLLRGQNNALQAQLQDDQRKADEKSKHLLALLAAAKPGDIRPLGPVAYAYYSGLRGSLASQTGHPANAGNP